MSQERPTASPQPLPEKSPALHLSQQSYIIATSGLASPSMLHPALHLQKYIQFVIEPRRQHMHGQNETD
jgi:hypothetical protein